MSNTKLFVICHNQKHRMWQRGVFSFSTYVPSCLWLTRNSGPAFSSWPPKDTNETSVGNTPNQELGHSSSVGGGLFRRTCIHTHVSTAVSDAVCESFERDYTGRCLARWYTPRGWRRQKNAKLIDVVIIWSRQYTFAWIYAREKHSNLGLGFWTSNSVDFGYSIPHCTISTIIRVWRIFILDSSWFGLFFSTPVQHGLRTRGGLFDRRVDDTRVLNS